MSAEARATVIREALSWIGTPYHQSADVKGAGVDCSMLLVRVYVDSGVLPAFDPRPYSPDWHMHNAEEKYLEWLDKYGRETETPMAGDCVVFKFGHCYSHGSILIDASTLVHAFARDKFVVLGTLDQPPFLHANGKRRERKFYSLW